MLFLYSERLTVCGVSCGCMQHMDKHGGSSSGASTSADDADLSTTSHRSTRQKSVKSDDGNASGSDTVCSLQKAGEFSPNKPWELQMDMLLQRLMVNSIHSELDVRYRPLCGIHEPDDLALFFVLKCNGGMC